MQMIYSITQKLFLTTLFVGSLMHATDVPVQSSDYSKTVLPRISEEIVQQCISKTENSFDRTKYTRYLLAPTVAAAAVITYQRWNNLGSVVIGSPIKICMDLGRTIGNCGIAIVNAPLRLCGYTGYNSFASSAVADAASVSPLDNDEIVKMRELLYAPLIPTIIANVGKAYVDSTLFNWIMYGSRFVWDSSAQNIQLFMQQSTNICKAKIDLIERFKKINEPMGPRSIEHYRIAVYSLCKNIIQDTTRIIAFMQAVNDYNDIDLAIVATQAQMLIAEANDFATEVEYKLESFDTTADVAKRQALIKEIIIKSLGFIKTIEIEVNNFVVLSNQNQDND